MIDTSHSHGDYKKHSNFTTANGGKQNAMGTCVHMTSIYIYIYIYTLLLAQPRDARGEDQ